MALKFSTEQKLAIDSRNQNIIVSAGAGSGKTAVLTERIRQILLSGVKANQLLVLTFTNAAAAEMKERITKTMANDPMLKNRTAEVDSAYITTFDSFSLSIVKKYHDRLNLSPSISIVDKSILNVYKRKIIDEIFINYYNSNNPSFNLLISDLTSKNDSDLKKQILKVAEKIDLKTNKKEYLRSYIKENYTEEKFEQYLNELTNILLEKIKFIEETLEKIYLEVDETVVDKHQKAYQQLLDCKTYDDIRMCKGAIRAPSITNASDTVKQHKEDIKKTIEDITKLTPFTHIEEMRQAYFNSSNYVQIIVDIIDEFYDKIEHFKYSHGAFEFNDIAKMAINLVKNNEDIRNELRDSFVEILIDEYQDTNDTQEEFISYICNNNVYMVGDIKQSIYGFRNANPMIFKNKYDEYKKHNGGMKIDLNQNFRSNRAVLNVINKIFNHIMDDEVGNANFKQEHQMRFGLTDYDKSSMVDKIKFVGYSIPEDESYKNKDVDMFFVLKDIQTKINNQELVYDKDLREYRVCEYKDFAILLADSSLFDSLSQLLSFNHIPNMIFKNVEVNKGVIVTLIKNIIKLIVLDYKKQYDESFLHCFFSVGRSFIIQDSDETLFNYITKKNYNDSPLYKKIHSYTDLILTHSLKEIVELLINDFDIYNKIIEIGDINENITRVEFVLKLIDSMDNLDLDIFDFVEYIDDILDNDDKMEFASSGMNDNKVKIMTIHKSKGLEFPIVYFINNDKLFNKSENKDKIIFDAKYGLITPYFIQGEGRTIKYLLMKENNNVSMISEKLRLLYVALTRAREQIIILNPIKSDCFSISEFDDIVPNVKRKKYNSFFSIYNSIFKLLNDCFVNVDVQTLNISDDYLFIKEEPFSSLIDYTDSKITHYNNNIESTIVEKSHASKEANNLVSDQSVKYMEYGSKVHEMFESCDFKNPDLSSYNEEEKTYLSNFFNSSLLKNINNGKIYKEFEFIYNNEENVQIHGIIDLMIEYDNYVDIIDYKLSHVDDEAYIKQLNTYKKYIELKSNKPVNLYLYSILKNTFKKLEE